MRFSLAALIPLAVLVAPVLSGVINAREFERKGEHHKGEHLAKVKHVKGHHHHGRDVGGNGSAWKPTWTWSGSGKQCPSDVHKDCPCLMDSECGFKCPQQWPVTNCTWEPVFENKSDWKEWKSGKYIPITTGYVNKATSELDCKTLCEAHEKCYSCQVFSPEKKEQSICALYGESVDIATWKADYEAGHSDHNDHYDTSCWNARY
ncbi:uncharacterized protein EV420DRAFT_26079 [Desarmillaria tabescens]|uniref:Apple domain-containing protein n=1 Tax=Armillaria tabescens TaxID=1929756 RepID=A0AA39TXL6_ARMTA|nr:uncharacterized protein EV420DRAFT_26079 [Desarmillaria tabescens]KAK0469348.1 hypothetical protein EV420DRAFT_26079 [Desarmillaria tabescens]